MATKEELEQQSNWFRKSNPKPEKTQIIPKEIQDFTESIKRGWTVDSNDDVSWSALID